MAHVYKICEGCGSEFKARETARFCSPSCKRTFNIRMSNEKFIARVPKKKKMRIDRKKLAEKSADIRTGPNRP